MEFLQTCIRTYLQHNVILSLLLHKTLEWMFYLVLIKKQFPSYMKNKSYFASWYNNQ